jgi:hypothetical protein
MDIEVTSAEAERVTGKTKDQPVEVQLTAVTEKTTRMKVKVGEGMKKDPRQPRRSCSRRNAYWPAARPPELRGAATSSARRTTTD